MTFIQSTAIITSIGTLILTAQASESPSLVHHVPGPAHRHHLHETDISSTKSIVTALSLGYDSRYVLEGRDALDGDPILHGTLALSYHDLLFEAWLAESPGGPYNEVNLLLEYSFMIGEVEAYVSYNHLRFPNDDAHDHEVGLGLSYGALPWEITAGIDAYYSLRAEGAFIEGSLAREFNPCSWLSMTPGIVLGWNEGFVSSGHRGANHLAAVLSASIPLSKQFEIGGYLSYNWAINSDPIRSPDDENLKDFFYGGLSTTFTF